MSENTLLTVLEEIVAERRTHLPALRERLSHVDLASVPRSERSLADALRGTNRFIMECKSASPSLGMIREDYRPGDIARIYSRYASAISVLCEPNRFGGDYDHLQTVALSTHVPVLCKDFIVDPIQVYAARYYGADAILLMMSIVDDDTYGELKALADECTKGLFFPVGKHTTYHPEILRQVAAAGPRRHLDVLDELGEELAALGVDRRLLVLRGCPF